jgi:Recombinase
VSPIRSEYRVTYLSGRTKPSVHGHLRRFRPLVVARWRMLRFGLGCNRMQRLRAEASHGVLQANLRHVQVRAGLLQVRVSVLLCLPFGSRPAKAAIVERIRKLRRKPIGEPRLSVAAIVNRLNEEGIAARQGPWRPSTVHAILADGLYRPRIGSTIENTCAGSD